MRGVVAARCPDQEDDSTPPHAEALQSQFPVTLASVLHRDHRAIEDGFQIRKIDPKFP